eukprot:g10003.t1
MASTEPGAEPAEEVPAFVQQDDVEKPKAPVVNVEIASTNRSRCKSCDCLQPIDKGTMRVGVPMFAQGRTITAYFHPECFFRGLSAETVERNNAGACKHTRVKFAKGDFRLRIACGNAKFGLAMDAARALLKPALEAAGKNLADVAGVSELPADMGKKFAGSSSASSKATPMEKSAAPSAASSKKAAASSTKAGAGESMGAALRLPARRLARSVTVGAARLMFVFASDAPFRIHASRPIWDSVDVVRAICEFRDEGTGSQCTPAGSLSLSSRGLNAACEEGYETVADVRAVAVIRDLARTGGLRLYRALEQALRPAPSALRALERTNGYGEWFRLNAVAVLPDFSWRVAKLSDEDVEQVEWSIANRFPFPQLYSGSAPDEISAAEMNKFAQLPRSMGQIVAAIKRAERVLWGDVTMGEDVRKTGGRKRFAARAVLAQESGVADSEPKLLTGAFAGGRRRTRYRRKEPPRREEELKVELAKQLWRRLLEFLFALGYQTGLRERLLQLRRKIVRHDVYRGSNFDFDVEFGRTRPWMRHEFRQLLYPTLRRMLYLSVASNLVLPKNEGMTIVNTLAARRSSNGFGAVPAPPLAETGEAEDYGGGEPFYQDHAFYDARDTLLLPSDDGAEDEEISSASGSGGTASPSIDASGHDQANDTYTAPRVPVPQSPFHYRIITHAQGGTRRERVPSRAGIRRFVVQHHNFPAAYVEALAPPIIFDPLSLREREEQDGRGSPSRGNLRQEFLLIRLKMGARMGGPGALLSFALPELACDETGRRDERMLKALASWDQRVLNLVECPG